MKSSKRQIKHNQTIGRNYHPTENLNGKERISITLYPLAFPLMNNNGRTLES